MPKLAQALRNAIEGERAAKRFYLDLAPKADCERGRDLFMLMAEQEEDHATTIEAIAAKLVSGTLPHDADSNVGNIETAPGWRHAERISVEEALELAISAEINASLYYDAIADLFTGEAEETFRNLSANEQEHADLLVNMRTRLGSA